MVKLSIILAAAAAAVLVFTSTAYAHSRDDILYDGDVNAALRQRHLRITTSFPDDSLGTADEEGTQLGKGSLDGHAPPSTDTGHGDKNIPCHDDGSDKPKDNHATKADHKKNEPQKVAGDKQHDGRHPPPSKEDDHHHRHDAASSSITGHDHAGDHTVVPPPPPSPPHDNAKGSNNHPGKGDNKTALTDHQRHNPADVGYDGRKPVRDGSKDAAHHLQGANAYAGKGAVHNASKGSNLHRNTPSGAGSADAYLKKGVDAGSPHTKK